MTRRRTILAAGGPALALALLLGGCAGGDAGEAAGGAPSAPPAEVAVSQAPLDAGGMQDPRVADHSGTLASANTPITMRIPAIAVVSALESLGIGDGGRLDAPVDYDVAGWYAGGVVPGAIGPAIIAGHIDSPTAPAVFARLGELTAGAEVFVTMSDGSELRFEVTGSTQSSKSNFPTAEVYSNVPAPELRLITCAGAFDSAIGHYTDNLIVFAAMRG